MRRPIAALARKIKLSVIIDCCSVRVYTCPRAYLNLQSHICIYIYTHADARERERINIFFGLGNISRVPGKRERAARILSPLVLYNARAAHL